MPHITDKLLGDGADLTGRAVFYWGHRWIITGKNYLGDWDVERFEDRADGRYRLHSTVCSNVTSNDHPHCADLIVAKPLTTREKMKARRCWRNARRCRNPRRWWYWHRQLGRITQTTQPNEQAALLR